VGDLAELTIPAGISDHLRNKVCEVIALQQRLDQYDETSPDFVSPLPWRAGWEMIQASRLRLRALEHEIDEEIASLYAMPKGNDNVDEPLDQLDVIDCARRWIAYALRVEMKDGEPLQLWPRSSNVLRRLRRALSLLAGDDEAGEIDSAAGGLETFLSRDFFAWHVALYRRRPILWVLSDRHAGFIIRHDCAAADALRPIARQLGASLPAHWDRNIDAGILPALAPLRDYLPSAPLRKALAELQPRNGPAAHRQRPSLPIQMTNDK
jgi:hypothetical protein